VKKRHHLVDIRVLAGVTYKKEKRTSRHKETRCFLKCVCTTEAGWPIHRIRYLYNTSIPTTRRLFPIHALTVGDQLVCGKFDPAPASTPVLPLPHPPNLSRLQNQPARLSERSIDRSAVFPDFSSLGSQNSANAKCNAYSCISSHASKEPKGKGKIIDTKAFSRWPEPVSMPSHRSNPSSQRKFRK
jgi:hypothetical protein